MSKFTKLNAGDVYNGFKVISIDEVENYGSDGILLEHLKSGMQVFHLFNEDEENLFAFGFRTPSENSTGVAHIIEHSVLCGSEKYPLKDPFIRLANQSVKTFLNAMTFPDKTVYPASSLAPQDYFNLMSVYGDAVFFPLLTKETFLQEGHRYEVNKNGKIEIQGVVFNEMKGNYSSFESVVQDQLVRKMFSDSCYQYDSGGDPVDIPDLTYEEFIDFHKRHYNPANCFLFLYGNIPTEKQLDFINERFLSRFDNLEKYKKDTELFNSMTYSKDFNQIKHECVKGPSNGGKDQDCSALVSWKMGEITDIEQYMKTVLVCEVLMGHDGSPLNKALLESNLGKDISPNSGLEGDLRYLMVTLGLRGLKKEDWGKFEEVINSTLNDIVSKGVDKKDLESAIMSVEFSNREISRNNGPYALTLMRRAYRSWMNGKSPYDGIMIYSAFEKIKKDIAANPKYIEDAIRELMLENKNCLYLLVEPDKNYSRRNDKVLEDKLSKIKKEMGKKEWPSFVSKVKEDLKKLNQYQTMPESEEKIKLLPHINPADLKCPDEKSNLKKEELHGIEVFSSQQNTNGIVYLQLGFPLDRVDIEDYPYLSFFSNCVTYMGFDGMDWAQGASEIARITGGLNASIFNPSLTDFALEKAGALNLKGKDRTEKLYEYDPNLGRFYLFVKVKVLQEKLDQGLKLLFRIIKTLKFSDLDRLTDLVNEYKNDALSSIVPCGHDYAMGRSSC
ncbi:MAG: insulinase family protein, partial [Treponemataceae bacterium]|nr:insulinase family protein [Treponemataceae bacterium]